MDDAGLSFPSDEFERREDFVTSETVDALSLHARERFDEILQALGFELPDRRPPNGYKLTCPFHSETKPSFHVYPDRGYAKCFGACQKHWSPLALIQAVKGWKQKGGFFDAVRFAGEVLGLDPNEPIPVSKLVYKLPRARGEDALRPLTLSPLDSEYVFRCAYVLGKRPDKKALWLKKGLPEESIRKVYLGYDQVRAAYVTPIWQRLPQTKDPNDQGHLVTVRYRRDDEVRDDGARFWGLTDNNPWGLVGDEVDERNQTTVYGIWQFDDPGASWDSDMVVLSEGETDTLALMSLGYTTFTLTNGVGHQIETWESVLSYLDHFDEWVLAFNWDAAGLNAVNRFVAHFPERSSMPPWPRPYFEALGVTDICDALVHEELGGEFVRQVFDERKRVQPTGERPVRVMNATRARLWSRYG